MTIYVSAYARTPDSRMSERPFLGLEWIAAFAGMTT
jgi:hypothetical protein